VQDTEDYCRYCPGAEGVKISDAVCLGRRRSNYLKCKECRFSDGDIEVPGSGGQISPDRQAAEAEKHQRSKVESLFKAYGIRGVYPDDLDEDMAWRIGHGVSEFLRSELRGYDRARPEMSSIVVGRDMRKSSRALADALMEGLCAGGSRVIDLGMIDTGQLYFAVNHLTCCGGVQITGGHYGADYNGFKICGLKGKLVGRETGLNKICMIALNTRRHSFGEAGGIEPADLGEVYKRFVCGFFSTGGGSYNGDRPLRLVIDASNGMAGRWIPLLFSEVEWLEVIRLNFEHNGDFHHDPNPLIESNLSQLKDRVAMSKADLGVCFDGDADRCVFVDHNSRTVSSDELTALLAQYFLKESPGSSVVYDLRFSRAVSEVIRESGGVPRRERSNHAAIKKVMLDSKSIFGGQRNGRYYFRENAYCDSGILALVHVLNVLTGRGQRLDEMLEPLRRYAVSGECRFDHADPAGAIRELSTKYGDGKIDYLDGLTVRYEDWWFNVRVSGSEPVLLLNLEAQDGARLGERLSELTELLGKPLDG